MPYPVLASERLQLARHELGDYPDSLRLWSSPEVARHVGGTPSSGEEVWSRLLRYAGHWDLLGFGCFVIRSAQTGCFLGEVGFADFKRDLQPGFEGAPEIGWALVPDAWGHGYGLEAVRTVLDWADTTLGAPHTVCMISPANERSRRLAERCGFRHYENAVYRGKPTSLFRRHKNGHPHQDADKN